MFNNPNNYLLKFLKRFFSPIRIGTSIGKTLLFIWIKKDLSKINGNLGIDLAGGAMLNKKFFRTKSYICVDINQVKLEKGKFENSDGMIINEDINVYMRKNYESKPDVLLCVQTMGTNIEFNHDETLKIIESMFYFLNQKGSMVFNIGSSSGDLNLISNKLKIFFEGKFESVQSKFYGNLHSSSHLYIHPYLRFFLAYMMHIIPPLRTLFGLKKKKLYFFCKNKI
jgi:hypothetical protein